jgi:hypothetical protein
VTDVRGRQEVWTERAVPVIERVRDVIRSVMVTIDAVTDTNGPIRYVPGRFMTTIGPDGTVSDSVVFPTGPVAGTCGPVVTATYARVVIRRDRVEMREAAVKMTERVVSIAGPAATM